MGLSETKNLWKLGSAGFKLIGEKMYSIKGLTSKQVAMLNIIWSFESNSQFEMWFESIPYRDKLTVESLLEILRHEMLEEAVSCFEDEAKEVLAKFVKRT